MSTIDVDEVVRAADEGKPREKRNKSEREREKGREVREEM